MKKIQRILPALTLLCALSFAIPQQSQAQFRLGASYEIRQEAPKHGFGARVERSLMGDGSSMVQLRARAHFSYFSEKFENYKSNPFSAELKNYDFGVAGVVGVKVGFVTPYAGLGLGAATFDLQREDLPQGSPFEESESESKIGWTGFIGAEVNPIPLLNPFVEYRFDPENRPDFADLKDSSTGRIIFGLSLAL